MYHLRAATQSTFVGFGGLLVDLLGIQHKYSTPAVTTGCALGWCDDRRVNTTAHTKFSGNSPYWGSTTAPYGEAQYWIGGGGRPDRRIGEQVGWLAEGRSVASHLRHRTSH